MYEYFWEVSVYMAVCSKLIEETGRPQGWHFAHIGIYYCTKNGFFEQWPFIGIFLSINARGEYLTDFK